MGQEIERKFLIKSKAYRKQATVIPIIQGFIGKDNKNVVRVRIKSKQAFLTIKGETLNASRSEYEYKIPLEEAREMLTNICKKPLIEKNRYELKYKNKQWEVDEFYGENQGLIIAEVELKHPDEKFEKPPWLGKEVTDDPKYFNVNLIKKPFSKW